MTTQWPEFHTPRCMEYTISHFTRHIFHKFLVCTFLLMMMLSKDHQNQNPNGHSFIPFRNYPRKSIKSLIYSTVVCGHQLIFSSILTLLQKQSSLIHETPKINYRHLENCIFLYLVCLAVSAQTSLAKSSMINISVVLLPRDPLINVPAV